MRRFIAIFVLLFPLAFSAYAIDPETVPEIVAKVGDEVITRQEILEDLEKTVGSSIRDKLFQTKIVEQEMRKRNIVISDEAVEARVRAILSRSTKKETNDSIEALRRGVRIQLAMEMMAKQDLRKHQQLPISNLELHRWLKDKLNKAEIIGRPEKLPKGAYAMINGEVITKKEFYDTLLRNTSEKDFRASMEKLIGRRVIKNEMNKRGVDVTDFDVEVEFKRMERRLQRDPAKRGLSLEDVLRMRGTSKIILKNDIDFRLTLAAKKMLRAQITEEEARRCLEEHKALYGNGEVRASQIFVAFVDLNTRRLKSPDAVEKAREKIERIYKELQAGADFADLARKYSEDKSAEKGGDLGFFPRYGRVPDPIAGVAFSLRKGEVSRPFPSNIGYHIVKVTDVRAPEHINFDAVKVEVIDDLVEARLTDFLKELRNRWKIERYWP